MFTAAICTTDRPNMLKKLLDALQPQISADKGYHIIVVDASCENYASSDYASMLFPNGELTYITGDYSGLSESRNIAIEACSTSYIAFIDDDALPSANWVRNIISTFSSEQNTCSAVGGKIKPLWLAPRPKWLPDELLPYLSLLNLGDEKKILSGDDNLYGTNMAFRTSVIKKLGGFNIELGRKAGILLSNEEAELQMRLRDNNYQVAYSPDIIVHHRIPASRTSKAWFYNRIYWQGISDFILENKDRDSALLLNDRRLSRTCPDSFINNKFVNEDDPYQFSQQCGMLYNKTRNFLDSTFI